MRSKCVRFSPNGTQWGAATTEGLLVYSLDNTLQFDPYDVFFFFFFFFFSLFFSLFPLFLMLYFFLFFQLDVDVTSSSVKNALKNKEYLKSLVLALRLGEDDVCFLPFFFLLDRTKSLMNRFY